MKDVKKYLSVCLSLLFSLSFAFTACSPNNQGNNSDINNDGTVEEEAIATVQWTDYDFIKEEKSEYVLLLPEDASNAEKICASEINVFLAEATGFTLPIKNESAETAGIDKFISIGETKNAKLNNINADYKELGTSGYIVKTLEDNVYILGDEPGIVYGAYELLKQQFNYGYYSDNVYTIEENVKEKKLVDFNVKEIPDIEYRQLSYGFEKSPSDSMYSYRMRMSEMQPKGLAGASWHNFLNAIPKEKWQSTHSNWFSPDGTNLCLMRDLNGIATEMVNVIIETLEADPTLEYIHVGQPDTRTWCDCQTCSAVIEAYDGYRVATYILFMNKVSDMLQPYLDEKGLDTKLTMFAYHATDAAPVTEDTVNGGYKIVSEDLRLNDNVYVLFAPIDADYYVDFDNTQNTIYRKNIIGWNLVSKKTLLWIYSETFGDYLTPFDNFNSMQRNFQLARDNNVFWCYNQAQWNNGNSTGFSHLKAYLSAHLQWDADANVETLVQEFFNGYFAEAASVMREVYEDYRTWRAYCYYELELSGSVYAASDAAHWPYAVLKGWLNKIDDAYKAIEKYKSVDNEEYRRLCNAINLESLAFRYRMIMHNAMYYSDTELYEMKKAFKKDAASLNVTKRSENVDIEYLYNDWGIS